MYPAIDLCSDHLDERWAFAQFEHPATRAFCFPFRGPLFVVSCYFIDLFPLWNYICADSPSFAHFYLSSIYLLELFFQVLTQLVFDQSVIASTLLLVQFCPASSFVIFPVLEKERLLCFYEIPALWVPRFLYTITERTFGPLLRNVRLILTLTLKSCLMLHPWMLGQTETVEKSRTRTILI